MFSIMLGVMNLLPVPVLDGGHLMYYVIEVIKGSPVSDRIQIMGYKVGLALVMSLMVVATYNDIARTF
jgi:regulator of sigma E protease